MSDTNDQGNSGGRKPLTVVRKTSGTVKQSFSHGRSKQVVVETKKRRPVSAGGGQGGGGDAGPATPSAADAMEAKLVALAAKLGITVAELKARQKVLEQRKAEEAARAKDNEREKAAQDRLRNEQERKQQEAREREEAEARRRAEEEAAKIAAEAAAREQRVERPTKAPRAAPATPAAPVAEEEADAGRGKRGGGAAGKPARDDRAERAREVANKASRDSGERRRGKLTIASALGDDADRQRSLTSVRRARERERERRMGGADHRDKVSIEVTLPETITLQELAQRMNERVADVVKYMIKQGEMLRAN
ncbi:MAG: translation initiation factor IF-2, partial [Hyphomonas sp. 32-62-5]